MTDAEKNVSGIEAVSDDALEAVAGGAFFKKCPRGKFEAQFPEKICKNCLHFERRDSVEKGKHLMICYFFDKGELKAKDWWGLT